MRKLAIKVGAILCLVLGLATLWLPIPTGLVLMLIGLSLLLMTSPQIAGWLSFLRRRYPSLDTRLRRAEPHLPRQLARALARTRASPILNKVPARQ